MKRNWGTVRKILLTVEEKGNCIQRPLTNTDFELDNDGSIFGHLKIMIDAELIDGSYTPTTGEPSIALQGLTWEGHELLDSIRKDSVWNRVSEKVAKAGGQVSMDLVKTLGTEILKQELIIQG